MYPYFEVWLKLPKSKAPARPEVILPDICKSKFNCNIGNEVTNEKPEDTHAYTHTQQLHGSSTLLAWPYTPVTLSIKPQQFCLAAQQHLSGTAERDSPLFSPPRLPSPCLTYSALAQAGDQLSNAMTIVFEQSPQLPLPRVGARDSTCSRTSLLAATQPQIRPSHP